jgi:hypothetical protein
VAESDEGVTEVLIAKIRAYTAGYDQLVDVERQIQFDGDWLDHRAAVIVRTLEPGSVQPAVTSFARAFEDARGLLPLDETGDTSAADSDLTLPPCDQDAPTELPAEYAGLVRVMGKAEVADWLRGHKRQWGNYQGVCGFGITSMTPGQRRAFQEREQQLERWLRANE